VTMPLRLRAERSRAVFAGDGRRLHDEPAPCARPTLTSTAETHDSARPCHAAAYAL
jgi:hypothetical protein